MSVTSLDGWRGSIAIWLQSQRWFGGKGRAIVAIEVPHSWRVADSNNHPLHAVRVTYDDHANEDYLCAWPGSWQPWNNSATGATVPDEWLTDSASLPQFWNELSTGRLTTWRSAAFWARSQAGVPGTVETVTFEQSNTSLLIDGQYLLKLFRKLTPGLNPDAEIGRFLAQQQGPTVSPPLQAIMSGSHEGADWTLGTLQTWLPSARTAWESLLDSLSAELATLNPTGIELPISCALAARLGHLTAQMHAILADGTAVDFVPEAWTEADSHAAEASQTAYAQQQFALLANRRNSLPPEVQPIVDRVLQLRDVLLSRFTGWQDLADGGRKTRIHGDYHLGQVLLTPAAPGMPEQLWVIDFEGEPARPLSERRRKRSPWQDVAGMVRSLNYAVIVAWRQSPPKIDLHAVTDTQLKLTQLLQTALLQGYGLAPTNTVGRRMLELFTLDKACYELGYELLNRPTWITVPAAGILSLADS